MTAATTGEVTGETITIAQLSELTCSICGAPAVCVGRYDLPEDAPPEPACDSCCGHGCEDGSCYHIRNEDGDPDPDALDWCAAAWNARHKEVGRG